MASTFMDSPTSESKSSQDASAARRRSPRISSTRPATLVLSADYLDRHSSKNDLVRRLRTVVDSLSEDEDVECNSPDYPGLAGLAAVLVEDRYLMHRDKEVRLHTVLACMEIFYLYAPEPPYNENEILKIFPQIIRQLANLAVCTSPSQPNFAQYFRLLEQLAVVKTGVVLVEMTRMLESESPRNTGGNRNNGDDASDGNASDGDGNVDDSLPTSGEALEVLANLIQTILQSVSIDHPSEVISHATAAISACVEEFDGTVPIPILDEILMCISAGPVIQVTNPAFVEATAALAIANKDRRKKGKKSVHVQPKTKLPPRTIQQTNQSYMVAASVMRRTEDRISTPTASLLNGILNGETNIIEQTNISSTDTTTTTTTPTSNATTATDHHNLPPPPADVWSIVYELHKTTPQILTTVIGTVASSLRFPTPQKRLRVTKLLGRLFSSRTSDIAIKFHPCYREWIKRSSDHDEGIRLVMVKYLVLILGQKWKEEGLCEEATDALVGVIRGDPCVEVRLAGIHQICDLVHSQKEDGGGKETSNGNGGLIAGRLLQAVGNRVSSKHKTERRNAVTGLAHIFYRRYILDKLKTVQCGGDDCDINVIMNAIHETCSFGVSLDNKGGKGGSSSTGSGGGSSLYNDKDLHLDGNEKYKFIPKLVFESACFTDATDPEMRNRVIQIVDGVLLGTGNANTNNKEEGIKKEPLTLTSRAVGLAIIMNSLQMLDRKGAIGTDNSNAFKWMRSLLCQRAHLQHAVSTYVKARSATERCTQGSEERMTADAAAIQKLELVASLSAPLSQISTPGSSPEDLPTVLNKFHTARDKHIFRLLASISLPNHSPQARVRVFEELPKRTNRLGVSTASWTKCLARRTAMGNYVNVEIITHCILLAQEAFRDGDFQVAMVFLNCVKMAVGIFPILGGNKECFGTLVELFSECRGSRTAELKKEIEKSGIVTVLSGILAAAASARSVRINKTAISSKISNGCDIGLDPDLQSELIRLCTKDGTPEQARHAIFTLAALAKKDAVKTTPDYVDEKENAIFMQVLKALTSPSRLSISTDSKGNSKLLCALTTLTAIVECAPSIFCSGTRYERAIRFTLETVLLGRGHATDEAAECGSDVETLDEEDECDRSASGNDSDARVSSSRRRSSMKGSGKSGNSMNDLPMTLSIPCRRACAAIDFLVGHIRSTIIYSSQPPYSKSGRGDIKLPSSQHILSVFNILINIIQDCGLPPSNRDRRECKGTKERAALRETATLNLLRLCDSRLKLESKYLSTKMWHILGGCFLDEEKSVRVNIMNELSMMLKGTGKYRDGFLGIAPSLRFLALTALCADNDQHAQGNLLLNGNAANVGRHSTNIKVAALTCISSLRQTCEATSVQCRAISRKAERNFDNNLKMKLMPEFALPFAFHILAFRPETPSAGDLSSNKKERLNNENNDEEGQHRMLHKRLRWLLEPLVQSLGESADNISFLLRQAEILGNKYRPIESSQIVYSSPAFSPPKGSPDTLFPSPSELQTTPIELHESPHSQKCDELFTSKLKIICTAARHVLLKFVKKDVNLTPYPGAMQIPSHLYTRNLPRLEVRQTENKLQGKNKISSSSGEKRKTAIEEHSASSGQRKKRVTYDQELALERCSKVQFSSDIGNSPKEGDDADASFTSWDMADKDDTPSIGHDTLFHKNEKGLSPIPQSNSPSSTPSSGIASGQSYIENEKGPAKNRATNSSNESHNLNLTPESLNDKSATELSEESAWQSPLSSRDVTSPSKKRHREKVTDTKTKKKKSSPVPIMMERKKNQTKLAVIKSARSRSRKNVVDNFEFIENDKNMHSDTIKVKAGGQQKSSTRRRLKKSSVNKLSKKRISTTPKERRQKLPDSLASSPDSVHPSQSDSAEIVTVIKKKPSEKEGVSLQQSQKKKENAPKARKPKFTRTSTTSLDSATSSQSTRRRSMRTQSRAIAS